MADKLKHKALLFYVFKRRQREQLLINNLILYAIKKRNMLHRLCLVAFSSFLNLKLETVCVLVVKQERQHILGNQQRIGIVWMSSEQINDISFCEAFQ